MFDLSQDHEDFRRVVKEFAAGGKYDLAVGTSHTGEEVIVAAHGPGSQLVKGFMPNTHIFDIMLAAWGWKK